MLPVSIQSFFYAFCGYFHIAAAPECGPYPGIENGTVSTLESTVFINGAQANYSCSEGCELQGSRSLRCLILDINLQQTTQWVNETGQEDIPSCFCPTAGGLQINYHTLYNQICLPLLLLLLKLQNLPPLLLRLLGALSPAVHIRT